MSGNGGLFAVRPASTQSRVVWALVIVAEVSVANPIRRGVASSKITLNDRIPLLFPLDLICGSAYRESSRKGQIERPHGGTQSPRKLALLLFGKSIALIEQRALIHGGDTTRPEFSFQRAAECDKGLLRCQPFKEVDPHPRTVIQQDFKILLA